MRVIGGLLLLLAAWVALGDIQAGELRQLGRVWLDVDPNSFIGIRSGIENRLSADLYLAIEPVFFLPAMLVPGVPGLLLLGAGVGLRRARRARA